MSKKKTKLADISKPSEQMATLDLKDLMPLPYPLTEDGLKPMKSLTEDQKCRYECSLDGICAVGMLKPESKEEEERRVKAFLEGLKKLLSQENNWTFLQPLMLSLKY